MNKIYQGNIIIGECSEGNIYRISGLNRELIATYENGKIYNYEGWNGSTLIGEYYDGRVYSVTGTLSREEIGSYYQGKIFRGSSFSTEYACTYEGEPIIAAAYLLFFDTKKSPKKQESGGSSTSDISFSFKPLLQILGLVVAIFLSCHLTYTFYTDFFTGKGTWAYTAMIAVSIIGFLAANIYALISYKKAKNKASFLKNLPSEGLSFQIFFSYILAYAVYIIELIVTKTFGIGEMLLGLLIAVVNLFTFILPFILLEFFILLIIKLVFIKKFR